MGLPGRVGTSFPAHRQMSRLLLPYVLHPWLPSALAELGAVELGAPSPPRREPPALLCMAFWRGTGALLIPNGWKDSPLISGARSSP